MDWTPQIIDDLFTERQRAELLSACDYAGNYKATYDPGFGRVTSNYVGLNPFFEVAAERARAIFNDDTLLPSYLLWARYDVPNSNLHPHKDDNACTFTLDYCVRQKEPWNLYVEGTPYVLQEGQALAFLGEDQEHWRDEFKHGNVVEMIFFHFVRPDHWFFNPEKERPERFRM